jgi:hypothetical protein
VREEHSWRAAPLGSFLRVSNNAVCVPTSDRVHDALHTNKLDGPAKNLMLGAQEELGAGGRLEGLGFGRWHENREDAGSWRNKSRRRPRRCLGRPGNI